MQRSPHLRYTSGKLHQIKACTIGQPRLNHCAVSLFCCYTHTHTQAHTGWLKPALTYISDWSQAAAGKWVCGAQTEDTLQPNTCGWDQMGLQENTQSETQTSVIVAERIRSDADIYIYIFFFVMTNTWDNMFMCDTISVNISMIKCAT